MKIKHIFSALLLCAAVACQPKEIETLSDIQVSGSYVAIDVNGGTASVDLTASDAWSVDAATVPEWLTVSPMSGAAGTAKLSFKADATTSTNTAEIKLNCGSQTQFINVIQYAAKSDPVIMTVAEALAVIKAAGAGKEAGSTYNLDGEYYVKGIVSKILEISPSYGNATYFLSDDGTYTSDNSLEVYRGKWFDGGNITKEDQFAIGDEITIAGELMSYKGTPETREATARVVSYKKSLISVTPTEFEVGKDESVVTAKVLYSGDGLEFTSNADWLSVSSMNRVADTTMVNIHVAANTADTRTGTVTLSSASGKDVSTVSVSVTQAPGFSAMPLPYNETFLAGKGGWETVDVVPVEGVASIWYNDSKYGMVAKSTKAIDSQAELISPNIDLSAVSKATLSFEHVQRFAGDVNAQLKLFVSADNGSSWTELLIPNYSDGKTWDYVSSGDISLNRFAGQLVKIKFQYNSDTVNYATWEIKNLSVKEEDAAITTIAGLNNSAAAAEAAWTGTFTDAVVTYVNGNNAFIEDATGGIQLYLKNHGLSAGMKINGTVSGKIKLYSGYAELTSVDGSKATVTTTDVPAPKVLTIKQLLASYLRWQNCQVKLEGVTFATALSASNRQGKITQDGAEIAAYSQVNGKVIMDGTGDLVCWPVRYNTTLQVGCWDSAHFTKK